MPLLLHIPPSFEHLRTTSKTPKICQKTTNYTVVLMLNMGFLNIKYFFASPLTRGDDLGRVVVPKEIRRVLRIREGDPLEIFTNNEGEVILKKYSPINELSQYANEYAETAASILGSTVVVSDTDQVIAVSGNGKKDLIDKKIDYELDKIIQSKNRYLNDQKIVVPIISQGDAIGSITILPKDMSKTLGDVELKAAEIGASFLARQMEN